MQSCGGIPIPIRLYYIIKHSPQVNSLELAHMQSLHDKVEEVEAKLMGDMAYMKTGHQHEMEELQNSYNTEVRLY